MDMLVEDQDRLEKQVATVPRSRVGLVKQRERNSSLISRKSRDH
jgi:hypothetical protein